MDSRARSRTGEDYALDELEDELLARRKELERKKRRQALEQEEEQLYHDECHWERTKKEEDRIRERCTQHGSSFHVRMSDMLPHGTHGAVLPPLCLGNTISLHQLL